ncbi:4'-phosphopantetheinyl transferase superfamily protein [Candidatus Omnitrophota bacterium]
MLGIDIINIARIKSMYQKHGLAFVEKILDQREISDLPLKKNSYFFKKLCCYIASKEAIFKACSEYKLEWKEISIRDISAAPKIQISRPNFKKKIKLTFSVRKDLVLSQAIVTE